MENTTGTKSAMALLDRENSQLHTLYFSSHHCKLCIFVSDEHEPVCHTCKNLHGCLECGLSFTLLLPLLRCAHFHCLISRNVQQASVNVNGCHFFSAWRNSFAHLCFLHTSMSDSMLSHCAPLLPSVTQQQHVMGYWWDGSTCAAVTPTSSCDLVGQHNKTALLSEQLSHNVTGLGVVPEV